MATVHVGDDQFEDQVLKSDLPVLVDFYAEWCGPCKMAAPILEELSTQYEGKLKIVKVDVDQSQKASAYGVMSIPTVVMFKKNDAGIMEEVDRQIGFGGKDKYEELIKKVVSA